MAGAPRACERNLIRSASRRALYAVELTLYVTFHKCAQLVVTYLRPAQLDHVAREFRLLEAESSPRSATVCR
jgi:hypothetical protein